jgi:hypothetical protein
MPARSGQDYVESLTRDLLITNPGLEPTQAEQEKPTEQSDGPPA